MTDTASEEKWYAVQNSVGNYDINVGPNIFDQSIAVVHENTIVGSTGDVLKKRAMLIASAPELLEALYACEKQAEAARLILITRLGEPEREAFWKAMNIREFARGAIAKAKGES